MEAVLSKADSELDEYTQKLWEAAAGLWEEIIKPLKAEIGQRLLILQEVIFNKVWVIEKHQ